MTAPAPFACDRLARAPYGVYEFPATCGPERVKDRLTKPDPLFQPSGPKLLPESAMARPLVVLVLSADGVTRRSCEQGLTVWGFEVLTASTGPEALYLMDSSRRIDVLVTDAELEGEIDGLAVAQLARERNPKVQLIYSAEYPHRIPRARMIDGSPCFRSPYGAQQIAGVINAVISRRAMPEAA